MRRLALLAVLILAVLPVVAAEKDADYYDRTATKPPMEWGFLLGPKLQYSDQLGLGVQGGYVWHTPGIVLLVGVDAVRIDGASRTVQGRHRYDDDLWGHPAPPVTVSVPGRTHGVVGVSVLFKLQKPK